VVGALPVGSQTPEGTADGRRAQGLGAQAEVTADLGSQRPWPRAALLAKGARTLGQETMETLALGRIEHRRPRPWDAGRRGEALEPTLCKGMQSVANGWDAPAARRGNLCGGLLLCASQ
jgi:hypothetical protein